jgi:hypothetical protein
VAIAGGGVSAHRQDEYLQAARLAIDPGRVEVELDLTPGIALADAILADVDANRDGSLSAEEQRAYASLVLGALALAVDGTSRRMQLDASRFPAADAMRRGEGIIRLHLSAMLPRLSIGTHQLFFRNDHHPDRSVYLANALVPGSAVVAVTAQRRDGVQRELTIDFTTRPGAATSTPVWLGTIAAAAGWAIFLRRRSR